MLVYNVLTGRLIDVSGDGGDRRLKRLRRKATAFWGAFERVRGCKLIHIVVTQVGLGYLDVKSVMRFLRRKVFRNVLAYLWVRENQRRGSEHLHILVVVPNFVYMPKPDSVPGWRWGYTSIQAVHSSIGYLVKYLQKSDIERGRRMSQLVFRFDVIKRLWSWLFKGHFWVTVDDLDKFGGWTGRSVWVVIWGWIRLLRFGGLMIGWG